MTTALLITIIVLLLFIVALVHYRTDTIIETLVKLANNQKKIYRTINTKSE